MLNDRRDGVLRVFSRSLSLIDERRERGREEGGHVDGCVRERSAGSVGNAYE
jgi:hypothetical protein